MSQAESRQQVQESLKKLREMLESGELDKQYRRAESSAQQLLKQLQEAEGRPTED